MDKIVVIEDDPGIRTVLRPALVLAGLTLCCLLLWNQTGRFRRAVERIAQLHGGEVSVRSAPGKGSVFTLSV